MLTCMRPRLRCHRMHIRRTGTQVQVHGPCVGLQGRERYPEQHNILHSCSIRLRTPPHLHAPRITRVSDRVRKRCASDVHLPADCGRTGVA